MSVQMRSNVLVVLAACIWLLPYAWLVSTSLRPLSDILSNTAAFVPTRLTLDAYREVFRTIDVPRLFVLTTAMSGLIAALQIALALPAAYALEKLRFRGKKFAELVVLACLLVPPQVTFVYVFSMFARARLVNTFGALVLPFAASAFGTFMVKTALSYVPDEIVEAARIDGASELTIVYRVLGPIVRPTLVSLFLLSFVFHWNDYFWPLVMTTDDSVRTLPLAVALFREQGTGVRWHLVMAANVVLSAPALLLFVVAQKQLFRAVGRR